MIYDWDMRIEEVNDYYKEYFTANKVYEVRDGKIIIDKDYKDSNKRFTLDEFFKQWAGDWTILRIKINNTWYKKEI